MESKRNSLLVDRYQIQKEINQLEEYSKKEENKDYIAAYSSRIKRLKDEVDDINDKLSISNTEIDNAKTTRISHFLY